jgi:CHAT domain-containing protein
MKIRLSVFFGLLLLVASLWSCKQAPVADCGYHQLSVDKAGLVGLASSLNELHAYAENNLFGVFDSLTEHTLADCQWQLEAVPVSVSTVLLHVRALRLQALMVQNIAMADSSLLLLGRCEELLNKHPLGSIQYIYERSYTYNLMAAAHALKHDYTLAAFYYHKSLSVGRMAPGVDIEMAKDYTNLSETYYYLSRTDLADVYSDSAALYINRGGQVLCSTGDSLVVWGYWFHRGKIKFLQARQAEIRGDTILRDALLKTSRQAFATAGHGLRQMPPERVINNLLYLYAHTGYAYLGGKPGLAELDTAQAYFEKTLALAPGNQLLELMITPALAYVLSQQGQCALAAGMIDSLQAQFPPVLASMPPGPASLLFYAYHEIARTKDKCEGQLASHTAEDTRLAYDVSLGLFEEMQRNLSDSESLENWSGNLNNYYLPPFEHALRQYRSQPTDEGFERLLQLSERGKAVALFRGLERQLAQRAWTGQRRDLLDRELWLNQQINTYRSTAQEEALAGAVRAMTTFVDSIRNSRDPQAHAFYLERHANIRPQLAELRTAYCREGAAVVSFQQGEGCMHVLVFTAFRDTVLTLAAGADFYKNMDAYRRSLSAEEGSLYRRSAHLFYQQFFATIDQWLGTMVEDVLVVWDKELHGLVLEALPTEPPGRRPWREIPYLLHKYAFSYTYSLASLQAGSSLRKLRPAPEEVGTFTVARPSDTAGCGQELPALTALQQQLQLLPKQLTNQHFANSRKEDFLKNAGRFRLLQLGMHACQPDAGKEAYYLIFEGDDDELLLSEAEVQNLNLSADLVLLATCLNGRGSNYTSEGRKSLARAFLYAGSQAVLASNELMHEAMLVALVRNVYHCSAVENLPVGKALQQAKRSYLATHDHNPYYWANWLLIGDPTVRLVK